MPKAGIKSKAKAKAKASHESVGEYLKRSMRGTSFLGLEHTMHIAFTLIVAGLVVAGGLLVAFIAFDKPATTYLSPMLMHGVPRAGIAATAFAGICALMLAAALAVLSPFLVILDRRTRAEWAKRPVFTGRLAYKLPIYIALGLVWLVNLGAIITMVWTLLYWLATLGQFGLLASPFASHFIPAALTAVVFGLVGWYLIRLAQGQNRSQTFSLALATIGGLLALTLLVTGVLALQNPALPNDSVLEGYSSGANWRHDLPKLYKY